MAAATLLVALSAGGALAIARHTGGATGASSNRGAHALFACHPHHPPHAVDTGHLLIVGASYTAGLGATTPSDGYAHRLAALLGQSARIDGVPGTGFLTAGNHHRGTFEQRLLRTPPRPRPDLVVIQGGRDDLQHPAGAEYAAARQTVCLAERRFADARVAVLGPIPGRLPVGPHLVAVDAALRHACRADGATYVDALRERWMTRADLRRYSGHVADHPGDAGYRYIAERTATALRPLLPRGVAPQS